MLIFLDKWVGFGGNFSEHSTKSPREFEIGSPIVPADEGPWCGASGEEPGKSTALPRYWIFSSAEAGAFCTFPDMLPRGKLRMNDAQIITYGVNTLSYLCCGLRFFCKYK